MKKTGIILFILTIFIIYTPVLAQNAVDDAIGSISSGAVYCDESGKVKLVAFKIDTLPEGLKFNLGSLAEDIQEELESGWIFHPIADENVTVSDSLVSIIFSTETTENTVEMPVIKIMEGSGADWEVSDDGHTLTRYKGESGCVMIPNFIGGKAITEVGAGKNGGNLTKGTGSEISAAVISNGITKINYGAFANMTTLSSVILPDTLTNIDYGGFYGAGLNQNIEFPPSLISIEKLAFQGSGLTGVKFNEGLESIGQQAFYKCASLTGELKLPDTLKSIGTLGFGQCAGLTGNLILPEHLDSLGAGCFKNCSGLSGDLTIPASLKYVPVQAFCLCSGFNGKLTISEGVEEIDDLAFGGGGGSAMNFTELELPSTLKHVGGYCFQYCAKIKHLELKEGLEFISDGAFDHLSGLDNEKLVIPSTVKTIGGDYDVDENTGYGDHVFYDMGKDSLFKAFEVAEGNKYFAVRDGVLYNAEYTRMVAYPRGKTDEEFVLPDTVTQIDALSFSRPAFLKKLTLPDNYDISAPIPKNSLNTDGSVLAIALYAYNSIEEIAVNGTNPNYTAKDGLLYSKDMKKLWYIPQAANGDIVIDDRCEEMAVGCLYIGSKNYVKWNSLSIPQSVISIDANVLDFINDFVADKVSIENSMYYTKDADGKTKPIEYIQGDADLSGTADQKDAKMVLKYASGLISDKDINLYAADIDGSGTVDILDAVLINTAAQANIS